MYPTLALTLMLVQAASAQAPQIASIRITPSKPVIIARDTLRVRAEALDAAGAVVGAAKIKFVPAGFANAGQVDSTGLVSTASPGTLPIVVIAGVPGGRPLTRRVEVSNVPGPPAAMKISTTPARAVVGQRIKLDAVAKTAFGDSTGDVPAWSSSAPAIARVADGGVLTAVAPGSATISATAGRARGTFSITVLPAPASLVITPEHPTVRTGDVVRFEAVAKDHNGKVIDGVTPTWSFSPGHGQLGDDGGFVGYEAGQYLVTGNLGSLSTVAAVTVTPRDVRRKTTIVGQITRTKFETSELWIHPNGKVAYLGTTGGGDRLYSIDISDPSKPAIVDSVQDDLRTLNDVMTTADGKVLVFTREGASSRKNGIVICTLDDPLHPKKVADFTDGVTGGVHSAFVYTDPKYGTHVFLTNDGTGAVDVVDISDPAHPKRAGSWHTETRAEAGRYIHDIDVQDGLLYGSYWNDGLIILDVGNGIKGGTPENPKFVSQFKYDLNALYRDAEITGGTGYVRGTHTAWRHKNYVFIADEVFGIQELQSKTGRAYGRLQVVDVSDIMNPKSVAWYEPEFGGVHNVWVAGDTLYMGAYNAGFRAFDISGELRGDLRAQGREIAHAQVSAPDGYVPNFTMTWGVVVKNNLAYVNDIDGGLFIVRMEPKTKE
ncbi:MAG: Ig-like domain-containing protein, partial [Gemmatimonadota bacterium]